MDGVVVLIPHARAVSQFYYMFMMFTGEVWICMSISLVVVTLCTLLILKHLLLPTDVTKLILENWGSIIGVPLSAYQRIASLRMLLLSWVLSCFVFNVHFQSLLTSNLVTPKFERNMDTLSELEANKSVIVINFANARGIAGQYPQNLIRPWLEHKIMEKITKGDTSAAYATHSSIAELLSLKKTEDGHPVYHIIKEILVPGFTTYMFPSNSPYLDEVNE